MQTTTEPRTTVYEPIPLEQGLRNYWYPIVQSPEVADKPVMVRCVSEDLVVWRDSKGTAYVFSDFCPHRATRLSNGHVQGDALQCIFHGLRFDGSGRCVMMPWEPDDSPALGRIRALAYPTEEVRGLIFAYLGDTEHFPAPPLQDELPAELWDDQYASYILPTEEYDCNWILSFEGMDKYHAAILHAYSALLGTGIAYEPGVDPVAATRGNRRMVLSRVPGRHRLEMQIYDLAGNFIGTGLDGDPDFVDEGNHLPTLNCLSVRPRQGGLPYHNLHWTIPIDTNRMRWLRYAGCKVTTPEERAEWDRFFHEVTLPRSRNIGLEDALVAVGQRSLAFARSHETLLGPDTGMARLRRLLENAHQAQAEGRRITPAEGRRFV
jgi:phenylpropionate dioxygenase-like ring-hydroxylating dioxygenase large terminal subunit